MTGPQGNAGPRLVAAGPDDRVVIARLIQLYLYDMAALSPFPIGADGLYAYDFLDRFWHFPYLFHEGAQIAGFALVIPDCPLTGRAPCWFMAEFFVLRPYRHTGLGRSMAAALLDRHQGPWHVASQRQNLQAQAFWSRVLPEQGRRDQDLAFDGDDWTLRVLDRPAPDTWPRIGAAPDRRGPGSARVRLGLNGQGDKGAA